MTMMTRVSDIPASHVRVLRNNVARGATLLDKKLPRWFRRVRPGRLDMASPCDCIVGQLNDGDYTDGLMRLGLRESAFVEDRQSEQVLQAQVRCGFERTDYARRHDCGEREFEMLAEIWREAILKRRKNAPARTAK